MPETMNLPGLGSVPKKYVAIGGGVFVIGVALWYRHKQTQAANIAASGANTGIDPATGYPYGSPEDAAALANQQSYVNPGTGSGSIGGTTGFVPPGQTGVPGGFANNAAWTQYAIQTLQSIGAVEDTTQLSAALGAYVTGTVPPDGGGSLINQAVSVAGYPPVSGPDGYPPHIRTAPVTIPEPTPTPTPTPTNTDWTTHTTVHEGEKLSQVLSGFNMSQSEFEAHNPGITGYYRWYITGRGYVPAGTPSAVIALNTGRDIPVLVKSGGW